MNDLSISAANSPLYAMPASTGLAAMLVAMILLAATPPAGAAQDESDAAREIRFEEDRTGASVEGSIKGRDSLNYTVRARQGQRMTVEMRTDNAASYFNIYPPGQGPGDEALFIGSTRGNRFSAVVPESGSYTIQVYLMRSAARRDETANYSLDVAVTEATPAAVPGPQLSWPGEYDASGDLPCSAGEPTFDRACPFRVRRQTAGTTIWTTSPLAPANLRVLQFRRGRFSSDDATGVRWQRQGNNWRLTIGEREFYLVPDAVIQGG